MNCKEYQDDLKRRAQNDEAARKTQQFLEVTNWFSNAEKSGLSITERNICRKSSTIIGEAQAQTPSVRWTLHESRGGGDFITSFSCGTETSQYVHDL